MRDNTKSINPVGLVELPDLAPAVADTGLTVITGPTLRDAARDIRAAIVAERAPVILALQTKTAGLQPFLTRASQSARVALLVPPDTEPMPVAGIAVVRLPAPLSEALAAVGVTGTRAPEVLVDVDGSPRAAGPGGADPHAPEEGPDDDDWLVDQKPASGAGRDRPLPPPWDDEPTPERAGPAADPQVVGGWVPELPPWTDEATPESSRPDGEPARGPDGAATWLHKGPGPRPAAPTVRTPGTDRAVRPGTASAVGAYPRGAPPNPFRDHGTDPDPGETVQPVDVFGSPWGHESRTTIRSGRRHHGDRAPLLMVFSGKGGPGKTSLSINVAQRAAELCPDLRVTLIDGNLGQGDIRTYLRFDPEARVRCLLDAALAGDPAAAVLDPDEANTARHPRLPPIRFAVALAPIGRQADPGLVTPAVYGQVLERARRSGDLVVMDTQIVEATDPTGIVDRLVAPALAGDAWGLAVCDTSSAGARNLHTVLADFQGRGMPPDRVTVLVNRAETAAAAGAVRLAYGQYAAAFAHIDRDPLVVADMNAGRFVHTRPEFATAIDQILGRILDRPEFDPRPADSCDGPGRRPRLRWWRR